MSNKKSENFDIIHAIHKTGDKFTNHQTGKGETILAEYLKDFNLLPHGTRKKKGGKRKRKRKEKTKKRGHKNKKMVMTIKYHKIKGWRDSTKEANFNKLLVKAYLKGIKTIIVQDDEYADKRYNVLNQIKKRKLL
tara:strand:+ start:11013 stop:11417 length:405 start_codon:yes stop_codon:yes gene_type:complete